MEFFTVSLFGHREISGLKQLENQLFPILKQILQTKNYVVFLVGCNGEFDIFAASVIKRVQKAMGKENSELIGVFPYSQKDMEYFEKYYDAVVIPECIGRMHPKGAITKRNRWMVEQADCLICYVDRENGGAYNAMKYAEKLSKKVINLAKKECAENE